MSALRRFAKGQGCALQIRGVCNGQRATTVLAHLRIANVAGVGQKPPDLVAVHACSSCHDVLDGRAKWPFDYEDADKLHAQLRALVTTLDRVSNHFSVV